MLSSKTAHIISFVIGLDFLLLSMYQAFFVEGAHFYTSFALGSWLVFDFIDYKLNNTSILTLFYSHRHRHAFYLLFFISFLFCFVVDYVWGVKVLKVWEWANYSWVHFIRMYLIMNASFVLGMYEFYRIVKTLLKDRVEEVNLLKFRIPRGKKEGLYISMLVFGIIFLVVPLFALVINIDHIGGYVMLLPFISITMISDSLTFLTGGEPVLEDYLRVNQLKTSSLGITVLVAFLFTEGLNYFGREWTYLRVPFYNIQLYSVPVSVLIGWVPLVVGCISMVNLAKHLDYLWNKAE